VTFLKEWGTLEIPDKLLIQSLGNRVGGIARPPDSPAVFVRGALPGEQIRIKNPRKKKNFVEASLVSVEKASPYRVEPFCRYYGVCGGCSLQHLDYSEQLEWKKKWVEKAVHSLNTPPVNHVVPSPVTEGYRNRVTFDISNGNLTLHAYRGDPVPVNSCPLMNDSSRKALKAFVSGGIPDGIRRVSVRGGSNTTHSVIELTGSFHSSPPAEWPSTVIRRKKSWEHLKPGRLFERIGRYTFEIQPGGFFQVNTKAAEELISIVLNHIPENSDSVLDLYGGSGTFGIPLAAQGSIVTSVELNTEASEGCASAGALNGIPSERLRVINAKDSTFINRALKNKTYFNTVITDPPRAGMGKLVTEHLSELNPARIVCISCNPFSAARDIAILTEGHYTIRQITPVDMFPHTDHVETVFFLERK
jgi:23S rRNA (uracil1939-C5)-methyltransferase